jgi:hypothetical protein
VIGLRLAAHIVNFFANEQKNPAVLILIIPLQPINPDIVVCDDDEIQTGRNGVFGDSGVVFFPVRVGGVHVHVTDSFVQKVLPQELLQCNMIQNVMLSFLRWLSKLGMFAIKLSLLQQ